MGNSRDTSVVQHIAKPCMLCLNKKLAIALHARETLLLIFGLEGNMLNKRTEIISKCRDNVKYNLENYDTKDYHQISNKL